MFLPNLRMQLTGLASRLSVAQCLSSRPALILIVILDFNRKSSNHIESPTSLFVGEVVNQKSVDCAFKNEFCSEQQIGGNGTLGLTF